MEGGRRILALIAMAMCLLPSITGQFVEVTPHEAVVLPGRNISILCKVSYEIKYCRMVIEGFPSAISLSPEVAGNGFRYFGKGLEYGECGISVDNVKELNNGKVVCTVSPSPGGFSEPSANMSLIVAKPPSPPELIYKRGYDRDGSFQVGEDLSIMCVVKEGRPAAKIVWYLDNQVLLDGVTQPTISEIPNSDLFTTTQNLTRRLRSSDHGRIIKCIAEHPALDRAYAIKQLELNVKYAPLPLEDPIIVFGIKIGEAGLINVTLEANPPPALEWVFNGQSVPAGQYDSTGRIDASAPIPLGNGRYNATLRIDTMTREDTEREYILNAANEAGSMTYHIRVSTLDEPQGVELDAGSIIGIVIAVLIVITAVFLIIFAKATNRWCFGDGVSGNTKHRNVGETSDTESQVQSGEESRMTETTTRPKENPLSKVMVLPKSINFKSLLPGGNKNKDKVSQVETPEPTEAVTQQEEEKPLQTTGDTQEQGLVYVELALKPKESPQGEKVAVGERTEYAEIVYNKQPIENKLDKKDEKK